uniref:Ycf20 n=2 Tax=Caulerpa TaxID=76312 RepID=A0A2P0QJ38_9CHLO|nr:hypothetical protein [Caulerpa manorensis]ARO74509.1 hypothetical protein [Caulerpa manorensis]ARR28384.1 hypothetical chloroplast RF20 [Caulerpa okamurae]
MRLWFFFIKFKNFLNLKKRKYLFSFFQSSCSFYFGLICGNLFGTFLVFIRTLIGNWDGLILLFLILFFEFLNIQTIKISNKKTQFALKRTRVIIIIQNIQLGLLLGFFIDAFKVGS